MLALTDPLRSIDLAPLFFYIYHPSIVLIKTILCHLNTPAAMAEISGTFSSNVSRIQTDLAKMKKLSDGGSFGESQTNEDKHTGKSKPKPSKQQLQHYKLLSQTLSQRLASHAEDFKASFKEHQKHVESRNKRVGKYGPSNTGTGSVSEKSPVKANASANVSGLSRGGLGQLGETKSAGFAMFNRPALVQTSVNRPGATESASTAVPQATHTAHPSLNPTPASASQTPQTQYQQPQGQSSSSAQPIALSVATVGTIGTFVDVDKLVGKGTGEDVGVPPVAPFTTSACMYAIAPK